MATILKLNPEPTFKVDVKIPQAGKEDGILTITYKHLPRSEIEKLDEEFKDNLGAEYVLKFVTAWAFDEELNKDNLELLFDNYPAALNAIITAYVSELAGYRAKN